MSDAPPEVTFYVIEDSSSGARLQLACRLTEKAYRAGQAVLVWHSDARELAQLDELLWTFGDDRNFLPHELLGTAGSTAPEAPVLLSAASVPEGPLGILLNLASEVPPCAERAARVLEIIDGDAERRAAGRARFKAYRERGWQPVSHQLRGT
jgi:DNA polymerase III subunit chi